MPGINCTGALDPVLWGGLKLYSCTLPSFGFVGLPMPQPPVTSWSQSRGALKLTFKCPGAPAAASGPPTKNLTDDELFFAWGAYELKVRFLHPA